MEKWLSSAATSSCKPRFEINVVPLLTMATHLPALPTRACLAHSHLTRGGEGGRRRGSRRARRWNGCRRARCDVDARSAPRDPWRSKPSCSPSPPQPGGGSSASQGDRDASSTSAMRSARLSSLPGSPAASPCVRVRRIGKPTADSSRPTSTSTRRKCRRSWSVLVAAEAVDKRVVDRQGRSTEAMVSTGSTAADPARTLVRCRKVSSGGPHGLSSALPARKSVSPRRRRRGLAFVSPRLE
jgi:hypothetical protein